MADLTALSDDDLKSAYAQSGSGLASMSDADLKSAYQRSTAPGGMNLGRGVWTGPEADAWASASMGHVLGAIGQGAWDAWDHGKNLGYSDDVNDWMKSAGIYNDAAKGQGSILRTYNEALIRPAVAATFGLFGALGRGISAPIAGAQAGAVAAGEEVGMPQLGRDIAALPEAFPLFGMETGLHTPHPPLTIPEVTKARDLGLIGERPPTETMPMGTMIVRKGGEVPADVGGDTMQPYAHPIPPDLLPPEVQAPATVHDVARSLDPETFSVYDAAARDKADLRTKIAEAQADVQAKALEQAPHQAEITDLERRLEDTTPRLAKKYTARLAEITPERDAFLDSDQMALLTRDTAEIQAMRQELMEADYRMRDLSPKVTAAYREAAQHFPEPVSDLSSDLSEPSKPSGKVENAESMPVSSAVVAPEPPVDARIVPSQPSTVLSGDHSEPFRPGKVENAAPPVDVRADVAAKLVAAGRPVEEANAAAALVEAHYEARAARFNGAKGSGAELYARDAPEVRAGRARTKQAEFAQTTRGKISINEGRNVITLMKDANASTFLHETGHAWLEELLSDAKDTAAPDGLRADAAMARKWLGADPEGQITTRQHEKFARGFERYMMEGVAPTQRLAGVFAQFKNWLTKIYQTVERLRAPITDDIRDVFNRLLNSDNPTTIVPDLLTEADKPGRDMTGHAAPAKATDPYEKLPKEPMRLINFLKSPVTVFGGTIHEKVIPGGLRDVGGDISAIIGGPKGRPGLINNKTGRELDAATEHAWEQGYFPEHDQRPDINHLLDKIREDASGNPQYSINDQAAVEAYHGVLDRNAEIDRLAAEHGIDTEGLTREQFFDKITEKLSVEEQARELASLEEAHAEEFRTMDDEVRDTNDPPHYDISEPRSLEDLENAIRQEDDARSARQGDAGDTGPGGAAGPAADREVGGGQGGRGDGSAGGDGAQAGQRGGGERSGGGTAGPEQRKSVPTKDGADELVDKAGNIRLDNLNSPDDVKQVLRDLAAQNDDFMVTRGGVISDAARREMADNLGLTVENFTAQKPPGVSPSVWADAVQKLTFQASADVSRLGKTFGDSGSPADGVAYLQAKQRLLMVADHFAGLTAEAGRTLRVFDKEGMSFAGDMVAKMQQDTGRTLFQMQQEAKAVGAMETTAQRAKMVQDTRELTKGEKVKAGIISYFINNLISGLITHAGYSTGNAVWATFKATALTAAEATIDEARAMFGHAPADRVYYGEVGAQLYAMWHGGIAGFKPGLVAVKTGISYMEGATRLAEAARGEMLPGMSPLGEAALRPAAISEALQAAHVPASVAEPVGYALETPSRVVAGIHTVFYAMNYEREIARQAFRAATSEGLTGLMFADRIAEITQNPPLAMVQAAHDEALSGVLMKRPDYGSARQSLAAMVNRSLPAKLIMPFMQIGMNILEEGLIKSSPIGLASREVRANLAGRNGEIAQTQQYARIMVGSGLAAGVMGLAAEGLITGGGPSDPREAALKEATGWKAYSLRVGDTYVPYRKYLGPLGPLVGGAANMYDVGHLMEQGQYTKAVGSAVLGFTEVVANETWMSGLSNLIDATRHYDTKGERYLRDLALSFVPFSSMLSQSARVIDQHQREVHSWTDALRNKLPGLSQGLYPQRDWTGREIDSHTMMSPSVARNDPTMAQMQAVEFYPAHLAHEILGVQLNGKQYDDYARVSGMLAKQRLDALVRTAGFADQPAGFQHKAMSDTLTAARKAGATFVLIQPENANILRQANAAREAQAQGKTQAEVKAVRSTP